MRRISVDNGQMLGWRVGYGDAMAERTRKQHRRTEETRHEGPEHGGTDSGAGGGRLKSELDGLLDEIDEVLEANAEEFVKGYVQKGGE